MAISRAKKEELLAQYKKLIETSEAVFLAEYTGMNVKNMEALRAKIDEVNGAFHVTKNKILMLALEEMDMPIPGNALTGQMAAGFAIEEIPSMAKTLVDFAKDDDKLHLVAGVMGGEVLTVDQVKALADLPTLPEVRAQIIGLISGPARNVASVLSSGVRQVVNVVHAYATSEENETES